MATYHQKFFLAVKAVVVSYVFSACSQLNLPPPTNPCLKGLSSPLSYDKLFQAIQSKECPVETLEDALKLLPEEYQRSFTLVYDSRSSQAASRQFPRVISFGDQANFILAFNGHPGQTNYDKLEMIAFDPKKRPMYELRSIMFPTGTNGLKKPQISEANPPECTSCHGKPPHPFMDQYSKWVGFYGSNDDFLKEVTAHDKYIRYNKFDDDEAKITFHNQERIDFLKFKETQMRQGRYRFLKPPWNLLEPASPFGSVYKGDMKFRPNSRLVGKLIDQNAQRVVAMLEENPDFEKVRSIFLAVALDCYWPMPVWRALDNKYGLEIDKAAYPGISEGFFSNMLPWNSYTLGNLYKKLGIDPKTWNLQVDPATMQEKIDEPKSDYNYFDGNQQMSHYILSYLMRSHAKRDSRFLPFIQKETDEYRRATTEEEYKKQVQKAQIDEANSYFPKSLDIHEMRNACDVLESDFIKNGEAPKPSGSFQTQSNPTKVNGATLDSNEKCEVPNQNTKPMSEKNLKQMMKNVIDSNQILHRIDTK